MDKMTADRETTDNTKAPQSGISLGAYVRVLLLGMFFGIVLVKSEIVRWQRIHDMFLLKDTTLYLIIGTAILVAMICMLWIKKYNIKTVDGQPIEYSPKPFHAGVIIGGMIFGAGWAITGACPGPIYAQIGGGALISFNTLLGALAGMFAYASMRPKLPH